MNGVTRRSAARAAEVWEPLHDVIDAVGRWVPAPEEFAIGRADGSRRGHRAPALTKQEEAALLNSVLFASFLPAASDLGPGDLPYLVPLFVPLIYRRTSKTGPVSAVEVLALSVTVDGVPLGELGSMPVLRSSRCRRQRVELTVRSTAHKALEEGTLTVIVGRKLGPAPTLSWIEADGSEQRVVLRPGVPVPSSAPAWVRFVRLSSPLGSICPADVDLGYAVTEDLANRATARLLAHFRPMVAGRMRHHEAVNNANIRIGGTPCNEDDRRNDLYECLLLHIRNYVAKAVRDNGTYTRDLFSYVAGCFKPASTRAMLGYMPRSGHQDPKGSSVRVSELVGALRQHAAIYRLTDPASARAHHAVHWILARRLRDRLGAGDLTIADLWDMWNRGDLPSGVQVPDLALWQMAIGHQARHVSFDPIDESGDPPPSIENCVAETPLPGEVSHTRAPDPPSEHDLDLLANPSAGALEMSGFFAITSQVAARLAASEPEVWARAMGEGRAVNRLLRSVMAPFLGDDDPDGAAERLRDACTDGVRWLSGDELIRAWESGGMVRR